MFSPYYAAARRRGSADPEEHVAVNCALYGESGGRWAMTERGSGRLARSANALRIGPSALFWEADRLAIELDEWAAPWPRRIRGSVTLTAQALPATEFVLDPQARHRWQPIAPRARLRVELSEPRLHWEGPAYLDRNAGDEPLEAAFRRWSWSRRPQARHGVAIDYDVVGRDGSERSLALSVGADGSLRAGDPAPPCRLPATRWGIARPARGPVTLERTLEDGPFYARSLVRGTHGQGVHEALSLERFERRWVQALLPFRMPRRR